MDGGQYVRSSYLWRDDLAGGGKCTTTEEGHLTVSIECGRMNWDGGRWIVGCTVKIGDGCLLPSEDDSSEDDLEVSHEIKQPDNFLGHIHYQFIRHHRARFPGLWTMTSLFRLTRQIRPIHPLLVRSFASKPPPPPTITHTPLHGEKSIPDVDQTTTHVPAPIPPPEDHAPIPADIVSGAPEDMHRRTVRIYRPAKGAMQSGLHGNLYWRLDWDVQPEDNRWEHPVMFWAARSVQGWCAVN
jgi:hypothetical protein